MSELEFAPLWVAFADQAQSEGEGLPWHRRRDDHCRRCNCDDVVVPPFPPHDRYHQKENHHLTIERVVLQLTTRLLFADSREFLAVWNNLLVTFIFII